MKDKEKQIEEMGKVMPEKIKDPLDNSRYIIFGKSLRREIARIYYNAGYRKVLLDTEDGKMVDCVQYAPWKLIKGYTEREVNKARKETAKEIFQDLYHDALLNTGETVELTKLEIETLAKRYGVEVED